MSRCTKYGWRGHWFKTLNPEKDNILKGSPDAKKCACGVYKSEEKLQELKNRVLTGYYENESNISRYTLPFLFLIGGVILAIFTWPIFNDILTSSFNADCESVFSESNTTCINSSDKPIFPFWVFTLMLTAFLFFFIRSFLNYGRY